MYLIKVILLIFFSCLNRIGMPQKKIQFQIFQPSEMLTTKEAVLLNSILEKSGKTYDFKAKKVAFLTGSSGSRILSKLDFFNICINPWIDKLKIPNIDIVELTPEEKSKSGGYDILILSWVKNFSDKQKRKVIEELAKH